jgi:uncharacterized protein (TIGR03118 family)
MKRSLLLLLPFAFAACSQEPALVPPVKSSSSTVSAKKTPAEDAAKKEDKAGYDETRLVSDIHALHAEIIDANLVNPWGLAFGPTGILWVANNHTGTSTLYNAAGAKQPLVVTIPGAGGGMGAPTGLIFNPTSDFVIPASTSAKFIFGGEDGTIAAWNGGTSAVIVADRSGSDAVYKSIAMASNGGANYLYATNFKHNQVDVFDASFQFVSSFTDPGVPAGFAPFGIHTIGGKLYVTFAKQLGPDNQDDEAGVGNGYVDIFNPDGTLLMRFASMGSLNSPWAVVLAPAGFGPLAGDILVGNFGDGFIGAYDPGTGNFLGFLNGKNHKPLSIEGLWDLTFGPGAASGTLYFSAGPDGETHGLLGTLSPR